MYCFYLCRWPALICPDPYCNLYYDALLNEKDEEDEITHIHVEFFGWPRSHAWVSPNNISPFSEKDPKNIKSKLKSCKINKSYQIAIEEASKALLLSCEQRLQNCTFKTVGDLSAKRNKKGIFDYSVYIETKNTKLYSVSDFYFAYFSI